MNPEHAFMIQNQWRTNEREVKNQMVAIILQSASIKLKNFKSIGIFSNALLTGGSRAIPVPQLPKPLLPPRLRSSVEGLNQEIERLVLRPSHIPGDDVDDVVCNYFSHDYFAIVVWKQSDQLSIEFKALDSKTLAPSLKLSSLSYNF